MRSSRAAAACAALIGTTSLAAGPEWPEMTDAGKVPSGAQVPGGFGALNKIHGALEGAAGGGLAGGVGDFQDMYLIQIADPSIFSASLDPADGGTADFDTRLWLFEPAGPATALGVLGNDDVSAVLTVSAFGNAADDGNGAMVSCPGLYYLAISGASSDPVSTVGAIFTLTSATEVSGPDGTGGSSPVTGWTADGAIGSYTIALTGVNFPTCPGDLDADGAVGFADLLDLLSSWGSCPGCPPDIECNGSVDFADLLALLSVWGLCFPM